MQLSKKEIFSEGKRLMVKGVGFGGRDDKILAVSPHHFDKCVKCGTSFQEGEAPRFKEGAMLPYHQACLESVDNA